MMHGVNLEWWRPLLWLCGIALAVLAGCFVYGFLRSFAVRLRDLTSDGALSMDATLNLSGACLISIMGCAGIAALGWYWASHGAYARGLVSVAVGIASGLAVAFVCKRRMRRSVLKGGWRSRLWS